MASISHGDGDQRGEQVLDLVAGQRDEPQRWWMAGVLGDRGHHQGGRAAYGHPHKLGYHPLLATRADTGEMLHARQP